MGALPLRNMSRVWGYVNSVELPIWFRPTGFRLYSWIFGCNIDEVEKDLKEYTSLGDFFYRRLKDGVRPTADVVLVCDTVSRSFYTSVLDALRVNRSALQTARCFTSVRSKVDVSNRLKEAPTPWTRSLVSIHAHPTVQQ